jgi:hypothetical protein
MYKGEEAHGMVGVTYGTNGERWRERRWSVRERDRSGKKK